VIWLKWMLCLRKELRRKIQFSLLLVQSNVPLTLDWLNMWLLISCAWKRERSSNSVPLMNCAAVLVLHTHTEWISEYWKETPPKIVDLKDIYSSINIGAYEVKRMKRKDTEIVLISSVHRILIHKLDFTISFTLISHE